MNTAQISVIVPIFRIAKYLPKCVDSLLEQSFRDFELILVDDGSPDSCPKICDDYALRDSRVKVIHKPNGGLVSARKAGLRQATGKYIAFVDGDDWVDKYYLDVLYKLAEANQSDLVVTGQFREFNGKIETIKPKKAGVFHRAEIENEILPNAIYNGRFCEHGLSTYVWNKLFKKELLEQVLYDVPNEVIMGEDAAITYAYLALCHTLTISRIPLYYYRQRHDSIVKSIENPQMEYYRLGLLMHFLKTKLQPVLDDKNLDEQIRYYLYSQILVRSGGLVYDGEGKLIFNPFLDVKSHSRLVVYSSGSFGQHILTTNSKQKFFQIVKWIDLDYHKLHVGDIYVKPISAINNDAFDNLIIATINPSNYDTIKTELKLMGIDEAKIVKINTDLEVIGTLLHKLGFDDEFRFRANTETSNEKAL
ncbi:glycosyltransferase family 2 protein [Robiginitalea sediminis]|uniref:glycosyltransferase family 2 protein n=1 Tax=Robiginitalea sediminis TaxID=1982593 RepID=UPI000B4A9999|nr:glycosyltransferase family 2 protein [Robiginitalea sediminis]